MDHLPTNDRLYNTINASGQQISTTLGPNQILSGLTTDHKSSEYFASTVCTQFPSYFSNYAVLILVATSVVVQLTHVCKFILMLIIAGKHTGFIIQVFFHLKYTHIKCEREVNKCFIEHPTLICIYRFDFPIQSWLCGIVHRTTLLHEHIPIGQSLQNRRKWTLGECVSSFLNHVITFCANIYMWSILSGVQASKQCSSWFE